MKRKEKDNPKLNNKEEIKKIKEEIKNGWNECKRFLVIYKS